MLCRLASTLSGRGLLRGPGASSRRGTLVELGTKKLLAFPLNYSVFDTFLAMPCVYRGQSPDAPLLLIASIHRIADKLLGNSLGLTPTVVTVSLLVCNALVTLERL